MHAPRHVMAAHAVSGQLEYEQLERLLSHNHGSPRPSWRSKRALREITEISHCNCCISRVCRFANTRCAVNTCSCHSEMRGRHPTPSALARSGSMCPMQTTMSHRCPCVYSCLVCNVLLSSGRVTQRLIRNASFCVSQAICLSGRLNDHRDSIAHSAAALCTPSAMMLLTLLPQNLKCNELQSRCY